MCLDATKSYVMIQRGSGLFEFSQDDQLVFSGQIRLLKELNVQVEVPTAGADETFAGGLNGSVSKDEIYAVFENSGYDLEDNFKNITNFKVHKNEVRGHVEWKNDWIYFLEGLLKFPVLENLTACCTHTPVSVRQIIIHPEVYENQPEKGTRVL